jgi:hypothetical protein
MLKIKQCYYKKKLCYPSLLANTECAVQLWEIILPDINVSEGKFATASPIGQLGVFAV